MKIKFWTKKAKNTFCSHFLKDNNLMWLLGVENLRNIEDEIFDSDLSCMIDDLGSYEDLMHKYRIQDWTKLENILKQRAEIERLKEENKSIKYCYEQSKEHNNRLAESCEKNCKKFNMTTRAEAIKEFAERLKKKTYPFPCAIGVENAVTIRGIDDLVKEMVGDKE